MLFSGLYRKEDECLRAAKTFIVANGGLSEVSMFTKIMLALTGQYKWPSFSPLPIEMILLPLNFPLNFYSLSVFGRANLTPIMILSDKKFSIKTANAPDLSELKLVQDDEDEWVRSSEWRSLFSFIQDGVNRLHGIPKELHRLAIERGKNDPLGKNMAWTGYNGSVFWSLVDYLQNNEDACGPIREQVSDIAGGAEPTPERNFARLLLYASDRKRPVNPNPSFEEGEETASSWVADIKGPEEFRRIAGDVSFTGKAGVYARNLSAGDYKQFVPVGRTNPKPGLFAARLRYYTVPDTYSLTGQISITIKMVNEQGKVVKTVKSDAISIMNSPGRWMSLQVLDVIPKGVNRLELSVNIISFPEGGSVYFDDFNLYQI
jgi:hypothetical protein